MKDEDIISRMRELAKGSSPFELALALSELRGGRLTAPAFVMFFFRSFHIPLPVLYDACLVAPIERPGNEQELDSLLDPFLSSRRR